MSACVCLEIYSDIIYGNVTLTLLQIHFQIYMNLQKAWIFDAQIGIYEFEYILFE